MDTADISIRDYTPHDEQELTSLLNASLGGGPTGAIDPAFLRWKHSNNPFGKSLMLVAEQDGKLVGLRAFMRWRFTRGPDHLRAARAVDAATHPDHQKQGIFTRLTQQGIERLKGETHLIYNTPNEKSLAGNLKLGWVEAGRIGVLLRLRRLRHRPGSVDTERAVPAASILGDGSGVAELVAAAAGPSDRLHTERTLEYLRWRYVDIPGISYWCCAQQAGNEMSGLAVFRLRERGGRAEASIAELIVRSGDIETARKLLKTIMSAVDVDHLLTVLPGGGTPRKAALRSGFIPIRRGPTFVVNPLDPQHRDDVAMDRWGLNLGDVEIF